MLKKQYWEGVTNKGRTEAINEIKDIISNNSGSIISFNRFSDMALSLMLEVEANKVNILFDILNKYMTVTGLSNESGNTNSMQDITVFFYITFGKSTGDLSIEIPQVPG